MRLLQLLIVCETQYRGINLAYAQVLTLTVGGEFTTFQLEPQSIMIDRRSAAFRSPLWLRRVFSA